jgi:hypothetical protein
MAEMVPEALDSLTGEEKNRVYRMLRLEVAPRAEGYDVTGALCAGATPSPPEYRAPAPESGMGGGIGQWPLSRVGPLATMAS